MYYTLLLILLIIGCKQNKEHTNTEKFFPDLPKCTCGLKPDEFNEFIERADVGKIETNVKAKFVQGTFEKEVNIFCRHIWPRQNDYYHDEPFTYDISLYPYSYYTLWIGKDIKIKEITQDEFNSKYISGVREIYSGNERGITYYNKDGVLCYLLDTPYVVVEHKLSLTEEAEKQVLKIINKHLEKVKVCERHKHVYQEVWKKYNDQGMDSKGN